MGLAGVDFTILVRLVLHPYYGRFILSLVCFFGNSAPESSVSFVLYVPSLMISEVCSPKKKGWFPKGANLACLPPPQKRLEKRLARPRFILGRCVCIAIWAFKWCKTLVFCTPFLRFLFAQGFDFGQLLTMLICRYEVQRNSCQVGCFAEK